MAAKIIDPSNGASTWAFGSHRWLKNIGILTKNASMNVKIIFSLINKIDEIKKDILFFKRTILIKRGREAEIVYINK